MISMILKRIFFLAGLLLALAAFEPETGDPVMDEGSGNLSLDVSASVSYNTMNSPGDDA